MKVNFANVASIIEAHFGSEIVRSIMAGLSIVASLTFRDRPHCISLIFVGPPGTGKSVSVEAFMKVNDAETKKYIYRADNFTPASFVSHSANKSKKQLEKIDLLPRIKNKIMLTKELSPLFRGDQTEMRKNFSVVTSVLDGKGYVTDSGAQGNRGYEDDHMFNWLGATTPFPDGTYQLMGQLGNRLLFYELGIDDAPTENDLIEFAENYEGSTGIHAVQHVLNDFIKDFFEHHPVNSMNMSEIKINKQLQTAIVRYATLLTNGRAVIELEDSNFVSNSTEAPYRVILSLQMLARATALIRQGSEVTLEDLNIIRHISFSSIPEKRRRLLQLLLLSGGKLDVSASASILKFTRETIRKHMQELSATGLVSYSQGNETTSTPAKITLSDSWQWLMQDSFALESVVFNDKTCSSPPINELGVRALKDKNERETNRLPCLNGLEGVSDSPVGDKRAESESESLSFAWELEARFRDWVM